MKKMMMMMIAAAAIVSVTSIGFAASSLHKIADQSKCEIGMKCTSCNGTGWMGNNKCFVCKGTGANSSY